MKLSLASAGVAAGLVTLGWVIFGEQDAKNAEAEEKSWDDYPDEFKDDTFPYDSHPNADTYDMADVENQYRIWENKIAEEWLGDCSVCDKAIYEKDDPQDDELCDDCFKTHKQCAVCQDYELYNEMTSCFTCGQNYCEDCDKYDSCEDMEAEYQPNQTLEDYDDEGLTHSSAIDGYEPFKYSVMTSRAETLSKTSCCCGADEANPCICMKQPEPMQCSAKEPMCPCYKELAKAKMGAETLEAEKVWGEKLISGWSGSNLSKKKAESECSWCKKESAKVRDVEYGGGGSICPNCHYAYRKLGYNPHKPPHPFKKSAESEDDDSTNCGVCEVKIGYDGAIHYEELDWCEKCYEEQMERDMQNYTHDETDCISCGFAISPTDVRVELVEGLCPDCNEYKWNNGEKVQCCCSEPTRKDDFCPEGGYNNSGDECKFECGHEECEAEMKAKYGAESFGAEYKKMNPIEKPMIAGVTSRITADGLEDLMMAEDKAMPIRHTRRLNGYYGIKGYDDASEDGFVYRIYRAPGTDDWFKAMVYDDNSVKDNFGRPTSRRLNPSGKMTISNDPPFLLIGAFPKFEDAKRALVFRMIQDGNYHHMITDGNLKWLLKENR